jgi:hypothetical protein
MPNVTNVGTLRQLHLGRDGGVVLLVLRRLPAPKITASGRRRWLASRPPSAVA